MSWRILERWFNVAPWKDAQFVTDNKGEKFWIYWDVERFEHAAELHVFYRGRWIGIINSLREKNRILMLADITIFELYQLRGRGLGKAMMQEFVRWARKNKFSEIRGFIKAHDGSTEEYLKEWYKRQGFKVYEAKPGIYHILLKLQAASSTSIA